jgi:peptidoglycan biosynthesis protein MviN/MurJ (putative lipid II flippase)
MVFNLILMFPFGHAGLALATTIAAITNAALLLRGSAQGTHLSSPSAPGSR